MAHAVSVRLDDEALQALTQLEETGVTRSEAIRTALIEAAARRYAGQVKEELADLEGDPVAWAAYLAEADATSVTDGIG